MPIRAILAIRAIRAGRAGEKLGAGVAKTKGLDAHGVHRGPIEGRSRVFERISSIACDLARQEHSVAVATPHEHYGIGAASGPRPVKIDSPSPASL